MSGNDEVRDMRLKMLSKAGYNQPLEQPLLDEFRRQEAEPVVIPVQNVNPISERTGQTLRRPGPNTITYQRDVDKSDKFYKSGWFITLTIMTVAIYAVVVYTIVTKK